MPVMVFVRLCALCTQASRHLGELPTARYEANASWTTLSPYLHISAHAVTVLYLAITC